MYDLNVTFDEYHYYAQRTRAEETSRSPEDQPKKNITDIILRRAQSHSPPNKVGSTSPQEKEARRDEKSQPQGRAEISDDEYVNVSRLIRNASWGAGFYLITTDILGPYGVGFALGPMGWGPGIALYTVFAISK